eukprot:2108029-Rhodomonas_salina.4
MFSGRGRSRGNEPRRDCGRSRTSCNTLANMALVYVSASASGLWSASPGRDTPAVTPRCTPRNVPADGT